MIVFQLCAISLVLQNKTITCRVRKQKVSFTENLAVDELQNVEMAIIGYLQRQYFSMLFSTSNPSKTLTHFLKKLLPKLCDGVLRVGGSLRKTVIDFDIKHPIIISQHSHLTKLLIRQYHTQLGHFGSSHA